MLKNRRIIQYINRVVGKEPWDLIQKFGHQDFLSSAWTQLTRQQKVVMKSTVSRVLRNVMRTGVFDGHLRVWDMSSSGGGDFGTDGRKVEATWYSMVEDSESCATFAVMTDICVEFSVTIASSGLLTSHTASFRS